MSLIDFCWICLQEGDLYQPCTCPRHVHVDCLALWQLHSAGTAEEHNCRFCSDLLPDWRKALGGGTHHERMPVVAVVFEGKEWRLRVPPTPEGALRFKRQVELITGVPFNEQVGIKFQCKSPTGVDVSLTGVRCLEAAIHCAAMHCASQHTSSLAPQQQSQQQPLLGNAVQQQRVVNGVDMEQRHVARGTSCCLSLQQEAPQAALPHRTQLQPPVAAANETQHSSAAFMSPNGSRSSAQCGNAHASGAKGVHAASIGDQLDEVTTQHTSSGTGSSSSSSCACTRLRYQGQQYCTRRGNGAGSKLAVLAKRCAGGLKAFFVGFKVEA